MSAKAKYVSPPPFDYEKFDVPDGLDLTIHFAPHNNSADLPENLADIMHASDAVIIEAVGGDNERHLEVLNGLVAQQPEAIRQAREWGRDSLNPTWRSYFYEALEGSGVAVVLPDLEYDHPNLAQYNQVTQYIVDAAVLSNFDYAMDVIKTLLPVKLELRKERDQVILENISSDLTDLMEVAPSRPFYAVGFYGSDHSVIGDALEHGALDMPSTSIRMVTDLISRTIQGDVYQKYLHEGKLNFLDQGRYLVELVLSLSRQEEMLRSSNPNSIAQNELYDRVNAIPKRELRSMYAEVVDQLHSSL